MARRKQVDDTGVKKKAVSPQKAKKKASPQKERGDGGRQPRSGASASLKATLSSSTSPSSSSSSSSSSSCSSSSSSPPSRRRSSAGKTSTSNSRQATVEIGWNDVVDDALLDECWELFVKLAEGQEVLHIEGVRDLLRGLKLWPSLTATSRRAAMEQLVREAVDVSFDGMNLTFDDCAALLPRARALLQPLGERLRTLAAVDEGVALCAAAAAGSTSALRQLLAGGALPSASDYMGRTALHLAAAGGHDQCIVALRTAGADVNQKDNWGWTPADCAMQSGRLGSFYLLGRLGGAPAHFSAGKKPDVGLFHMWSEIWREILDLDDADVGGAGADDDGDDDGSLAAQSASLRDGKPSFRRKSSSRRQSMRLGGEQGDKEAPAATLRAVVRWLGLRGLRPARTRAVTSNVVHQLGMGSLPLNEELRLLSLKANVEEASAANLRRNPSAGADGPAKPGNGAPTTSPSGRQQQQQKQHEQSNDGTPSARVQFEAAERTSGAPPVDRTPSSLPRPGSSDRSPLIERPANLSRRLSVGSSVRSRPGVHGGAPGTNMSQPIPYAAFRSMLLNDTGLVAKAAGDRLAIPNWDEFCGEIERIFEEVRADVPETAGANADYIPELAEFDPTLFAVSVVTVDGQTFSCGDANVEFPIESCSKPLTYSLVCEDLGVETVHKFVGREPSGVAFNSFQLNKNGHPHNACINAGAMMTCALLHRLDNMASRFNKLSTGFAALAGGIRCGFNQAVYLSEKSTAHRNFALAYFMKQHDGFPNDSNYLESVDLYFQACSINVTNNSLAAMAATLANNGVSPLSGQRILQPNVVKSTLNLMSSCGMYDFSGEWATTVGVPAKSGVSGCIYIVVPGRLAMSVWSPPLDSIGNSVRGIAFCQRFVDEFKCSLLDIVFEHK